MNRVVIVITDEGTQILSDEKVEIHVFDFEDIKAGGETKYPEIFKSDKMTKKFYQQLLNDVKEEEARYS